MQTITDPRVDAYIDAAAPFAQPILRSIRAAVHEALPQAVETIKWSMPNFLLDGRIVCHMAAFKAHCALGFWRSDELLGEQAAAGAMGQFGRITNIDDLPPREALIALLRRAGELPQSPPRKRVAGSTKPSLAVPDDLLAALRAAPAALRQFEAFAPSRQREYCEWIVDAKRDETRRRRITQAIEWIADGKGRNWKYERC